MSQISHSDGGGLLFLTQDSNPVKVKRNIDSKKTKFILKIYLFIKKKWLNFINILKGQIYDLIYDYQGKIAVERSRIMKKNNIILQSKID